MPSFARKRIIYSRKTPTVLDLFSGAGGTGLGFYNAGFRIVGAVEKNASAALTYQRNLGISVKCKDINTIFPAKLREELGLRKGQLDVLVGCPPCQGFSRMRNSKGASDDRNKLVLLYLRFVKVFMPKFAVFENVPGMIRSTHGRIFYTALCTGLRDLGYRILEQEVNVADYGVPQKRKRVIVVAARDGFPLRFPQPTHGAPGSRAVLQGRRQPWRTVDDAIGNNRYPPLAAGEDGTEEGAHPNHIAPPTGPDVLNFITQVPHDGGSRRDVAPEHWLPCHQNFDGHKDVYGRLAWDRPSGTITSGCTNPSKGRFVHPEQNRAITPREAAALQGFPDDFVFHGTTIPAQIGNAVPPPLAEAIAETIRECLAQRTSTPRYFSTHVRRSPQLDRTTQARLKTVPRVPTCRQVAAGRYRRPLADRQRSLVSTR